MGKGRAAGQPICGSPTSCRVGTDRTDSNPFNPGIESVSCASCVMDFMPYDLDVHGLSLCPSVALCGSFSCSSLRLGLFSWRSWRSLREPVQGCFSLFFCAPCGKESSADPGNFSRQNAKIARANRNCPALLAVVAPLEREPLDRTSRAARPRTCHAGRRGVTDCTDSDGGAEGEQPTTSQPGREHIQVFCSRRIRPGRGRPGSKQPLNPCLWSPRRPRRGAMERLWHDENCISPTPHFHSLPVFLPLFSDPGVQSFAGRA